MYPLGVFFFFLRFCQQTVNVCPPISFKWMWRNHDMARIYQPFILPGYFTHAKNMVG